MPDPKSKTSAMGDMQIPRGALTAVGRLPVAIPNLGGHTDRLGTYC